MKKKHISNKHFKISHVQHNEIATNKHHSMLYSFPNNEFEFKIKTIRYVVISHCTVKLHIISL